MNGHPSHHKLLENQKSVKEYQKNRSFIAKTNKVNKLRKKSTFFLGLNKIKIKFTKNARKF